MSYERKYVVELEGEWTRPMTVPQDITMMRQIARNTSFGGNLGWHGKFPSCITDARIMAKQLPSRNAGFRGACARHGTFTATVVFASGNWLPRNRARARAKQILKWALQDITCRPPLLHSIEMVSMRSTGEQITFVDEGAV